MARSIDDINPFGPSGVTIGNLSAGQEYDPFNPNQGFFGDLGFGGGGGGGYTPPVDPNPVYVPPTYSEPNSGSLKINLISGEPVEFFENDTLVGLGVSQTLTYSPSLTFGNSKIYKANIANKISKNYFEVSVKRTHFRPLLEENPINNTIPFNDVGPTRIGDVFNQSFNNLPIGRRLGFTNVPPDDYPSGTPTLLDINFRERIRIQEFVYNETTQEYDAGDVSALQSVNGVVNLNFSFITKVISDGDDDDIINDPVIINYNIDFVSNYTNALGEFINLDFQIIDRKNDIVDSGTCKLADGNIDERSTDETRLTAGTVNISIRESYETARLLLNEQNLPEGFTYQNIYWAPKTVWEKTKADSSVPGEALGWNLAGKFFKVSGKEFASGIVVAIVFNEKRTIEITKYKPIITLADFAKEFEVKDSDDDKLIRIPFTTTKAEYVDVYISDTPIRVQAINGFVELSFKNDFGGIYGGKIIYFIPWNEFGRGETVSDIIRFIAVNDFPSITQITLPETIDIPAFSDLNIEFEVEYNTFAASSVDVYILDVNNEKVPLLSNIQPNGSFTVNLKTLVTQFLKGNQIDLTFIFVPYNRTGAKELIGNEYELTTLVTYPKLNLDESQIKKAIFDTISENLKFNELALESKYLTHLANFGNNEQIIISSWEEDDWTLSEKTEDELGNLVISNKVDSILLKLYSPLPSNITTNSTFWVTKLITNPLIETVVLTEQFDLKCPPIKGPNFNIEYNFASGQSTNFESLDNLILSSSVSASTTLVANYLSSSLVDTDDLNIEYYKGENYLTGSIQWKNFVHFSSAKERVDNFVYKVQLIEAYDTAISASYYTGSANPTIAAHIISTSAKQERDRQRIKKEKVIQTFDGFEKFLYTSSSYTSTGNNSVTWPYVNGLPVSTTNTGIINVWYNNLIELAEVYDIENPHYIQNNIPQYILQNDENNDLLLFFSMIGHHFDNIYFYTKSIEKSRNRGYKKTDISEKLLYDTLQSLGWDAKNIAANSKLWEYALGLNSDGEIKNTKSPKDRNNEIWRRILNNLPYLLKNKGTRRGVYAMMACYGIPSSNLSILEFGGPEASKRFTEETESGLTKVTMDNLTYVLNMNVGSKIEMDWKNTNKGRKPNTVELFVKPNNHTNYQTLISGSGWSLQLSGSTNSEYGKVAFNYNGSTALSSSLLPIFNDRFFGISMSSGSNGLSLSLKQVSGEREIFEETITGSALTNWNNGTKIAIGGNYSGSLDEFRLWSTPLSSSAFYKHAFFPEAINGNHISSSTDDLYFRLDFEYPKNLYVTQSLINVDTNTYFEVGYSRNDYESGSLIPLYSENTTPLLYASASGFSSSINFEPLERTITLEVPNIGGSRYSTNKVRFESQTDINGNDVSGGVDLSIKSRATRKAFDQSPTDSNRVGLFFSPTKELNIDIAKSFGGINLDNYIGDPSDEYRSNYKSLDKLRNYYFQRFDDRDIYQYIGLIKAYEKSLFDDIKKMLPARVKATTGLLIEPHILERSKIEQTKPTGEDYQHESEIDTRKHTIAVAENNQHESIIDANLSENVFGENNQLETIITSASISKTTAENYQYTSLIDAENQIITNAESYQKDVTINAGLGEPTILSEIDIYDINTIAGQSDYETIGFSVYGQNGHSIRTYYDADGNLKKERVLINLVKEQKSRDILKYKIKIGDKGDPRGGLILTSSVYFETKLNIQPYTGSTGNPNTLPTIGGKIVAVTPLEGYLPTHYRNTNDLTRGLKNSYYLGSKNTAATTLDGAPPVETFATNPNTLRVNKAGRDASEPILEVE
jgi:hypothetical protein